MTLLDFVEKRLVKAGIPLEFVDVEQRTFNNEIMDGVRFDIHLDGKEI